MAGKYTYWCVHPAPSLHNTATGEGSNSLVQVPVAQAEWILWRCLKFAIKTIKFEPEFGVILPSRQTYGLQFTGVRGSLITMLAADF